MAIGFCLSVTLLLAVWLMAKCDQIPKGTVLEEPTFTVYLVDVPADVELTAVSLNGQEFTVPLTNTISSTITEMVNPDNTHGYTLKVPFEDPVVIRQYSKEVAVMQYMLDINYTLTAVEENEPFYHQESVMAIMDVSPPVFDAVCLESGISFRLDHRPFDYMWELNIGSEPLTPELVAQHGYVMTNDTQSLLLEVPLFTHGYKYKDITLEGFSGTFEISVQDRDTSEVQSPTVKTCPFSATEFIMCSADGKMTVVVDLSRAIPSGGVPASANLMNPYCGPKEVDSTRALFSFPLNSCGSTVKPSRGFVAVTYENEILIGMKLRSLKNPADPSNAIDRLRVQCTYPVAGLHRLFSVHRFEADEDGVGSIVRSAYSTEGPQSPIIKPPTVLQKPVRTQRPVSIRPGYQPPAQHIKVSSFLGKLSKGAKGSSQAKVNPAIH